MSSGQFREKVGTLITSNNQNEVSATRVRAVLIEAADAIDLAYSAATDPTKVAQMQELLSLALAAKDAAETAKNNAILGVNPLGEYNATTNVPALTATPSVGLVNDSFYNITVAGNAAFAGSNFAAGAALAIGGKLTKKATQWYYQPPSDLALTKATALEAKAVTVLETSTGANIAVQFLGDDGNVIYTIFKDGRTFPPIPLEPIEVSNISTGLLDLITANTDFDDNYDYLNGPDVIENAIFSAWNYPLAVYDGECLFVGSVGSGKNGTKGEVKVSVKRGIDGNIRSRIIGRVRTVDDRTDDHDAAVICRDTRVGAAKPLTFFQADHNSHPTRIWAQASTNPDKWSTNFVDMGQNVGYVQHHVNGANPDEQIIFSRVDSAQPRKWRLAWTTDNGANWNSKVFFDGDGWMYFTTKSNSSKSKVNIAAYAHGLNSSDHRIFGLVLDWATGAIYAPGSSATPVVANFRTQMTNGSYVPFDVRTAGRVLVPQPATNLIKLNDIGASDSGECLVSYTEFPAGKTMASFKAARNKVISFSLDTGAINFTLDVGEAGMPTDRRTDAEWDYFGGIGIIDNKTLATVVYKNASYLANGSNVMDNGGNSVVNIVDISNTANLITTEIYKSGYKCRKPTYVAGSDFLLITECMSFTTFTEFTANVRILNLKRALYQ